MLDEAFALATRVLAEHREGFTQLAELLLEKEVVFSEDLERIFGKRIKDIKREQAAAVRSGEVADAVPAGDADAGDDVVAAGTEEVADGGEAADV